MEPSEELGDGAYDLEDADDAGDGERLVLEVGLVDGDEEEGVGQRAATEDLDGADGVEDDGVDLAVLDVVDGALSEGDDVAVGDSWLHGVAGDVAPEVGLLESGDDDSEGGEVGLVVEDLVETAEEIDVEVWFALGRVGGDLGLRLRIGCDSFGGAALQHLPSPSQ